jgi:hypothetical protein
MAGCVRVWQWLLGASMYPLAGWNPRNPTSTQRHNPPPRQAAPPAHRASSLYSDTAPPSIERMGCCCLR